MPAAVPRGRLAARRYDEDEAHGLGGGGEEMAATRELAIADEPQVRLVDQGRGSSVAGLLLGQLFRCQPPQLIVTKGSAVGGALVALFKGTQDMGYIAHRRPRGLKAPGTRRPILQQGPTCWFA